MRIGGHGTLVTCMALRKVFSFADALGHVADFFRARRDPAVAWTSADEKIAGDAASQHYGAACALRLDHCLSMVRGRSSGMARVCARGFGLSALVGQSCQDA